MGRLSLLVIGALMLLALSAAAAQATTPAVLLLSGNVKELEVKLTGEASKLETVGGKTIAAKTVEATLKGCEELEGKALDTNLCKDVPIAFKGTKKEETPCRSENAKGEKDAVETVLALADLHLDSEMTSGGTLEPLLVAKMLGTALEEEVTIVCGVLKEKVKGRLGCLLLPGLTNIATTEKAQVLCKIKPESKGIQETGTCVETKVLCEELANDPFLANLGSGFESAAMELHLEGSPSKDLFIDD